MSKYLTDGQLAEAANGLLWVNCENLHKGRCVVYWLECAYHSLVFSLKLYVPLNVASALFKGKSVLKDPAKAVFDVVKGSSRSAAVLTSMVLFAKITICKYVTYVNKGDAFAMFLASLTVMPATLIESTGKISEFSLYVMPRFFDAFWKFLKRRKFVKSFPMFQVFLFSFATAVMSYASFVENDIIKSTLRELLVRFVGVN